MLKVTKMQSPLETDATLAAIETTRDVHRKLYNILTRSHTTVRTGIRERSG